MPDVEIIRKQIIVVDAVGNNSYGDLTFTDKEGKEYKVGNKRISYFRDVIISGAAVQLNFSTYKGREYVYSAELVKDGLPAPTIPETGKTVAQIKAEEIHKETVIPGQQIGMTVKAILDLIVAGKLAFVFGDEIAAKLAEWVRGQILATTRVTYDGSQLPTLYKKDRKEV